MTDREELREIEAEEGVRVEDERVYYATQTQLVLRRFKRHKLAVLGLAMLLVGYTLAAFSPFWSPYDKIERAGNIYVPPQRIHFRDENGWTAPYVYGLRQTTDPETWEQVTEPDTDARYRVKFFVKGSEYKLLGLFKSNIHLFGSEDGQMRVFLLGTDDLGRDVFSRILQAASISMSIGLVGVFLSFVLGTLLGGISGYYGGKTDVIIQRVIEFLTSIPTIPLWMALSAAVPAHWDPIKVYFAITLILSLQGWCGLARVVRGKLLELREADYVIAARIAGTNDFAIITRHLLPGFTSYLIVNITLAIPGMILGETSLSFLGLGLRPPIVSWGVLLYQAQNVRTVALHPWLMVPALAVILTVLAFNFVGDGLRDAADPYANVA
ncbi:MAG: ABC transporter permease [Chloroflexi bacterium]|nr:ABC transporter permease [Chloroflexota bacterium]